MSMDIFKTIAKKTVDFVTEHSSTILTCLGTAGLIAAGAMACYATVSATKVVEEKKEKDGVDDLDKKEVVKLTWKMYIPAASTMVISVVCIAGARAMDFKRNAALMAAYTISENKLSEYQKKVKEVVGEEKEEDIRKKTIDERLNDIDLNSAYVQRTGKGETLCYDSFGGALFYSSVEEINSALNRFNADLLTEDWKSVNDFYDELGLRSVGYGEILGWSIQNGLVDISIDAHLINGKPCVCIDYRETPIPVYRS